LNEPVNQTDLDKNSIQITSLQRNSSNGPTSSASSVIATTATDTALAITATATTANPYMLLTTAFVIALDALV